MRISIYPNRRGGSDHTIFLNIFIFRCNLSFCSVGKVNSRLQKWYTSQTEKSKKKITREIIAAVLSRKPKMSSFLEWKDLKIVYKR